MAAYSAYTDLDLLDLLREGDIKCFAEIYERYWALLLRYAHTMVRNADDAEDIVQDVFQMLLEKKGIQIHTSLNAFLYTSIRYRILKEIRHNKVSAKYLSTLQDLIDHGVESTDLDLEQKELAKRIEEGLNKLPPKMKEVFELSRFHDHSYKQIAEKLNLAEDTVKKHISRALKSMRKSVGKHLSLFF